MFVFITTLRHPDNMVDTAKSYSLFRNSLASVCNQTNQNYKVVVICNEIPQINFNSNKVEFVVVPFPAPGDGQGSELSISNTYLDKGSKYCVGLIKAKEYSPEHIMFFDSDDYVNRNIVEFVSGNDSAKGWLVKKGYIYGHNQAIIRKLDNFYYICGTSKIVSAKLLPIPRGVSEKTPQAEILERFGQNYVRHVLSGHRWFKEIMEYQGHQIDFLPFEGAIYITGTSENRSGVGKLRYGLPVTNDIKRDFQLPLKGNSVTNLFKFVYDLWYGLLNTKPKTPRVKIKSAPKNLDFEAIKNDMDLLRNLKHARN